MRIILLLLLVCNLSAQVTIDLDNLKQNYVDLSRYEGDTVIFKGHYQGDRLVFKNADNISLHFIGKISTTHAEDAVVFSGDVSGLVVSGNLRLDGAMTFWAKLYDVEISGMHFNRAHTGIRFTQQWPHEWVRIHDNTFNRIEHEGIYAGPHYGNPDKLRNIQIYNNRLVSTGWDAIQVGNCLDCTIERNKIIRAGTRKEYGQDWSITVNPGSRVYLRKNILINCPNRLQCLDSRCFEW